MDSINVRNLEQIQEDDVRPKTSRVGTFVLASLVGAALVTVGVLTAKRQGPPARSNEDPLAALVSQAKTDTAAAPERVDNRDVTFPGILSDDEKPTTALAAVKDERGRLLKQEEPLILPPGSPALPPPAGDRLPVVPLPAGTLLSATPVTTQPKDALTQLAANASKVSENAELAPAGMDGGYQIQVASFKDQLDADKFVEDLRKRGHRAFRQPAYVQTRGLWHRVRIGPFKTKYEADQYRLKFEKTERVSPFVIDPHRVKQAEEMRAEKLDLRIKKYGRQ